MGKNTSSQPTELKIKLNSVLDRLNLAVRKLKLDFIITYCDIDLNRDLGRLITTIFSDSQDILTIRSTNKNLTAQNFGYTDLYLCHQELPRSGVLANVALALGNRIPQRILAIPYYLDDVLSAIAIKDLFDVPLCTYLTDDRNIYTNNIPDEYLRELLQKSDLRLCISKELCQAYATKYNLKFWYLPPVIKESSIVTDLNKTEIGNKKGIVFGNNLRKENLESWHNFFQDSPIKLDYFFAGNIIETALSEKLKAVSFAVIVSESSSNSSPLNLPFWLSYLVAANLPIIVIGNKETAVAEFVTRHKIGLVCDRDRAAFETAVNYISEPKNNAKIRDFAAKLAKMLGATGVKDWLWESLRCAKAADLRYENLEKTVTAADAIITLDEKTQKHGTGALVRRIFANNKNNISIRSNNHYQADQEFGNLDIWLANEGLSRQEVFTEILRLLGNSSIKRIYCTPYSAAELIAAIAVKEIFDAPIVTYIMDDQNYCINKISDDLMGEFLNKCSLRLATHPELRDAYQAKYGLKFWLLPAIVPDRLIKNSPSIPDRELLKSQTGALMGSIWSPLWFEMLENAIIGAKVTIDWYGNSDYPWLKQSLAELAAKGLNCCGLLAETELVAKLQNYPYIIVPVGTLDERDDRQELRISLPGRIIFILASTNTPIILMGSKETSAALFLDRFGIGVTCDYDGESLAKAVAYVTKPEIQAEMRQKAASIAAKFSDKDIEKWIWQSLALEQPVDRKFEELLSPRESDLLVYIEPPIPKQFSKDFNFNQLYRAMRRLVNRGFDPDFIIDLGCSYGMRSASMARIFPNSRFIAIDPVIAKYPNQLRDYYLSLIPNIEILSLAASDRVGKISLQVCSDPYKNTLLHPADFTNYETISVDANSIDNIAKEKNITGRGILKLDLQYGSANSVLAGAKHFLSQVDLIVAKLPLIEYDPQTLTWAKAIALMAELDFRYYDESDEWRSPVDGTLLHKEAVFIKKDLFLPELPTKISGDRELATAKAKQIEGFVNKLANKI